ncbi:MAG: sensor histidine kinase [Solirubrobacterales bacterium]
MTLRRKLGLPMVLVSVVIAAYLTGLWMPRQQAEAEADHLRLVRNHLESVAEGLVPLILGQELDSVHQTLSTLLARNPDWRALVVTDARGRQLFPLAGTSLPQSLPGGSLRRLEVPIDIGGSPVGQLTVDLDIAPALELDRRQILELTALLVGMFGALVVTMMLTIELAIRRPVAQLAKASRCLARQDFDVALPRAGSDEVGELVSTFASMRDSLRSTVDALNRSNAELERFAYIASHDLQEPVRTLVGYSQLLERRYATVIDGDGKVFLDFIIAAAKRMHEMVYDLLAYSRVNTHNIDFKPVDLADAARLARDNLQAAIAESGAVLTIDEAALPVVTGDRIQLIQVFQNLLANAIKFHRPGVTPEVHVTASAGPGGCTVSVTDNGIGIAPEYREKIFVIFRRLHTQATYPGSGLGLALCKRIVERHGGTIWCEDAAQGGSVFRFTLPGRIDRAERAVAGG